MPDTATWLPGHNTTVARVLTREYGLGAHTTWSLDRESVNSLWRVETSDGQYVLKRLGRDIAPRWLAFEGAALPRIAAAGIPIAPPLPTATGAGSVVHDGSVWQLRPWRRGRPFDSARPGDIEQVGAFLSALHRVPVEGLPADGHCSTRNLEFWLATERPPHEVLDEVDEIAAPYVSAAVRAAARRAFSAVLCRARTELAGYAGLPEVLTHGEVAGSNLLYSDSGELACVLDWDALQLRSRVYDIARGLLFLPRRARGSFQILSDRARAVLDASTAHQPLVPDELDSLIPVLELNFVPSPDYLRQVTRHTPGHLEWYLGWRAEGAASVRGILSDVIATAARGAER
ncbi:phosphotransferase enzyme family protein [Streptomyces coffeae]|uniref:Phosphotransferase n=1 Tax=Streptomyces coffeae TaxID=621382 RepID=A0ABS1NCZ5_9ACTN|nr:phosphotransferase [Streptomyces coffeae]MBL1097936.1 phosphotransferase [Streptomyces coffeae]